MTFSQISVIEKDLQISLESNIAFSMIRGLLNFWLSTNESEELQKKKKLNPVIRSNR